VDLARPLISDAASIKTHLVLRWLLIIAVSAMILSSQKLLIGPLIAYAFLFCFLLSNCLLHFIPPAILCRSELYLGLGIVDIMTSTLALVISGVNDMNFYLMYGLAIIIAASGQDLKRALLSTILIFFFYYAIIAGHGGKIALDFKFHLGLLNTLIITTLCAYLLQRLRTERLQKQETVGLYQQSKSQVEIQRFLTELNQDIATLDIQNLMQKLTDMVRTHLRVDISDVSLLDGQVTKMIAVSGVERKLLADGKLGSRARRLQRMLETRQPIVVADATRDSPGLKSGATRYPGIHGYLGVPFLSRTGEVIGFLRALTFEPRQFNDQEVELLQQIANGAAIFLENTRLVNALKSSNLDLQRTSREQRSLQDLLSDIFLLDVDRLLQKVTEEAVSLFDADIASIRVLDEQGRKRGAALAGNPDIVKKSQIEAENTAVGRLKWIIDNKRSLAAKDIGHEARDRRQDGVKKLELRGFLGAPLLSREQRPLGVIYLMTREPREFSNREISLIEQFANGAAIAIENATLLQNLRDKTKELQSTNMRLEHLLEEQSALREIFKQINLLDSNQLLGKLANHTLRLLQVDHVQVRLLNKDGVLETVAFAGEGAERFRYRLLTSGKGRSTWIMKNRRPAMIRDISQDMYFGPGNLMHEMGVKAYLGVPLLSRQQEAIGVLIATKLTESSFTDDAIALAEQLAAGATIAIENARLFEEVQEASIKIEAALQTKTAFMNTMAHELRTPLSVILGIHELFDQGVYGETSEEQKQAWERVRRNAQGLLDLVNDTLDLVRLESGKVPLHTESLSVRKLAEELVSALLPLAVKKGLDLKFEVNDADIVMLSDQAKLKTILQNLLANAVKYTDQGGVYARAHVTNPKDPNSKVVFSVRDTGIGIKEDQLKHVFEAFFMAEGVDRLKYPGTGFGLTIVQRLAELLGGTVAVESELGKGSTFTVTLPVNHPEAQILK
jgi:signal transduction histidine kinase